MADYKKVQIVDSNGNLLDEVNVKDEVARNGLAGKVNKSGDTMTGNLIISGAEKVLKFVPGDTSKMEYGQIYIRNNERLAFWQRNANGGNELYLLPVMNTSVTGNNYYDILTSKNPVTVAQGGTGGTDSGWQAYTNSSVFTGTIYYRRIGVLFEICAAQINVTNKVNSKSNIKLMTVPSEYMPSKEIYPTCYANTENVNNRLLPMRLAYTGELFLYANGSDAVETTYNLNFSGFGF